MAQPPATVVPERRVTQFGLLRIAFLIVLSVAFFFAIRYLVTVVGIKPPTPRLDLYTSQMVRPIAAASALVMFAGFLIFAVLAIANRNPVMDGRTWRRLAAENGRFRFPNLLRLSVQQVPPQGLAITASHGTSRGQSTVAGCSARSR